MSKESQKVQKLFKQLRKHPENRFPPKRKHLDVTFKHGVYIISKNKKVLHVGRTTRGRNGINQRLKNHLHGLSSFVKNYLDSNGAVLREDGYTYQFIVLEDERKRERALLEAYATGVLCPEYIGLGDKGQKEKMSE